MLLEIFLEIVLIWAFLVTFSSIITPKNLVTVSLSRVMPSMNSSGNFVGMKRFLEVGQFGDSQFGFININRELICSELSGDTF